MAAWFKWKTQKSLEAWFSCLNFLPYPASIIFLQLFSSQTQVQVPIRAHGEQWGSSGHPAQLPPVQENVGLRLFLTYRWEMQENIWVTAPGWLHHFPGKAPASFPAFHGTIPSLLLRNSTGIFWGSKILWDGVIHPPAPANDYCSWWEWMVLVFVCFFNIWWLSGRCIWGKHILFVIKGPYLSGGPGSVTSFIELDVRGLFQP